MKKNVLVVFGSMTPEHDLSCKSAGYIVELMDKEKFNPIPVGITKDGQWFYTQATPDEIRDAKAWEESPTNKRAVLDTNYGANRLIVFNDENTVDFIHVDLIFARIAGNTGEDGKLQGLFEMSGIPYVGCGVMASAVSMDKQISYLFADSIGLRRPMTHIVMKEDYAKDKKAVIDDILNTLIKEKGYPVFVKPASTGSSVGISKVDELSKLEKALDAALEYGEKVILEEGITGSELKVAVLGNENPKFGVLSEFRGEWRDYTRKYEADDDTYRRIPAEFSPEVEKMIKDGALGIYRAMECRGFSRIDFFLTDDNELVFNEINTMPGLKPESVYSVLFDKAGVPYTEMLTMLFETAL